MEKSLHFIALLLALSSPCCGNNWPQRFEETCSSAGPVSESTVKDFVSAISSMHVNQLSSAEVADILSSTNRCLTSREMHRRQIGLMFLMALEARWPQLDLPPADVKPLEDIVLDSSSPLQRGALYFLLTMRPAISNEVLDFLQDQLKRTDLSPRTSLGIVATLVGIGGDRAKSAFSFADSQKDVSIQIAAVQQLGHLHRELSPTDLNFIATHLDSDDQFVRLRQCGNVK